MKTNISNRVKNLFFLVIIYIVLPIVFFGGAATECATAGEIKGADGKVVKLDKPKHQAPKVREYTKFFGIMENNDGTKDSVFVTKNGKYCLIKPNKNGNGWHPVWLKENK